MKEVKLQVKGMSCSGCEQRIQKVLARIEGVVRATADHRAEEVRVMFDPNRTSEEALRLSIEGSGYEVLP
jgi:copper chaperone